MIARLCGQVVQIGPRYLVLDVNGVGYGVSVPDRLLENLEPGAALTLHVHTQVREDDISLYGFAHPVDLQFFRLLLGVSGVGPKVALGILSAYGASTLARLILEGDQKSISRIHGLGPKTAGRVILELQEKVGLVLPSPGGDEATPMGEALDILTSLGLSEREAARILERAARTQPAPLALDTLIEEALALLSCPDKT